MSDKVHPMAPDHLPGFLPGADGSDPLYTVVVIILLVIFFSVGLLYFKLHALPEHIAHRQNNTQMQIISVLAILALFTHNNVFWVGALLMAVVRFPDYATPLNSIANNLEAMRKNSGAGPLEDDEAVKGRPGGELSHREGQEGDPVEQLSHRREGEN